MTEVVIICDGCKTRSRPFKSAGGRGPKTARDELRVIGWDADSRKGRDYCPACVGRIAAENQEKARK